MEKKSVNIPFIILIVVLLLFSFLALLYNRYTYKMYKSNMTNAEEVRYFPSTPNNYFPNLA